MTDEKLEKALELSKRIKKLKDFKEEFKLTKPELGFSLKYFYKNQYNSYKTVFIENLSNTETDKELIDLVKNDISYFIRSRIQHFLDQLISKLEKEYKSL